MRILLLTQFFQPEPMFKGLPLAQALVARGHHVQVLTGFPNYPGGKLYPGYRLRLWQREIIDGIEVIRVPLFPSHDASGWRRMATYLSFLLSCLLLGVWLVRRPQVIYVYNLITLHFVAPAYRLLFSCKTVIDVQDIWPESVTDSGMLRESRLKRFLSAWSNWEYRTADQVIVLSPGFSDNLKARGVNTDKITVVYNWCDEVATLQTRSDGAANSRSKFIVTFAGTVGLMQSLDVVIAAAKEFERIDPHVHFQIIGDGIDLDRLKHLATGLKNINFVGRVPVSEIGSYYHDSDALLVHLKAIPLFQITIPSKIQAYLYAGRPILNGVPGEAAALIERSGAGLNFQPEDAKSLVSCVVELQRLSLSTREQMGAAGKAFYDQELCSRAGFERLANVLEQAFNAATRS